MGILAFPKDKEVFQIVDFKNKRALNQICIYLPYAHPRLNYLVNFFRDYLEDVQIEICTQTEKYLQWKGISIQYGLHPLKEAEFRMYNSGKLLLPFKELLPLPYRDTREGVQLFPDPHSQDFDLFAALFAMLARVEEYDREELDALGRFPAAKNILVRLGKQEIPVVDQWMHHFIAALNHQFKSSLKARKHLPSWSIGFDIDHFFKHRHKGTIKIWGGIVKALLHGDLKNALERIQVVYGNRPDPFACYLKLKKIHREGDFWISFILSGGQSAYDKNQPLDHPAVKPVLLLLSEFSEIGLHPSFSSHDSLEELKKEKLLLERHIGRSVYRSRQHYLKLKFPQSYQDLIACTIRNDYSMGFAEIPGFRAGISRPFFWYDLAKEQETELRVYPFAAMDRTCLSYMKWSSGESTSHIKSLFERTIQYGGHFHLIWHNSSFDFEGEWKSWEGVLEKLLLCFRQGPITEDQKN